MNYTPLTKEGIKNVFYEIFHANVSFTKGEVLMCIENGHTEGLAPTDLTYGALYIVRVGGRSDVFLKNDRDIIERYPTSFFISVLKP